MSGYTSGARPDDALVRRAAAGDERAMKELHDRYAVRVRRVVARYAEDDGAVDDWSQEAWIRAFRALPRFRRESSFWTWLHRITVNSALDGRRRWSRRAGREDAFSTLDGAARAGAARPARPLLRLSLQRALAQVPGGMRRVLILHDWEGYTHDEIAGILGVSPGTSKSQLSKARAKLRMLLRTDEPASFPVLPVEPAA